MPFELPAKLALPLAVAALCAAASSGCEKSEPAKAPAAEQQQQQAQESSAGESDVPEEFREQYEAALAEARELELDLRDGTQEQPQGSGTEAMEEALAPFASVNATAFGKDFYATLRQGQKPPAQVTQMVESRTSELEALSRALSHRTFDPRISQGEAHDQGSATTASVIQAAKLLAASGVLAGPDACLERATDILRLAMASSYGQGYIGAMHQSAVAGIGKAAVTGCGEKASPEAASNAAAHIAWLLEARPDLVSATYFEMLAQIPMIGRIVSGEVKDAEISKEQARESIAFRLELLPKLRELTSEESYEKRRQRLEALVDPQKDPLLDLQDGFFPRIAKRDAQLHRDLKGLVSWLDAKRADKP